jgi:Domain of Unknown Function (DUF1206)
MTALVAPRTAEAHHAVLNVAGRCGLIARAVVYGLMGWIAIDVARGKPSQQANQKGAIAEIAGKPGGTALLVALAIGLGGYALWRFSQAAFGSITDGRKAGPRAKSFARGVAYAALCAVTIGFLTGSSRSGQAQQQEDLTARLMHSMAGRWLVAIGGIVVVVVGGYLVVDGLRRGFARELDRARMGEATERTVIGLGVVGNVARGLIIALAGVLAVAAAITHDPGKSTGLDGAARTLAHQPAGPWLLGAVAAGLVAFGLFGLAAAAWTKI